MSSKHRPVANTSPWIIFGLSRQVVNRIVNPGFWIICLVTCIRIPVTGLARENFKMNASTSTSVTVKTEGGGERKSKQQVDLEVE
jgi:hypothetical protein